MAKTNDRVRKRIEADLDGEEPLAVMHLRRVAAEGAPNRSGQISSTTGGSDLEAAMLGRHGFDPGTFPGTGPNERRDLVGAWCTVTPTRLVFHANDTGWKVVRPRPAGLVATFERDSLRGIEYADHMMSAIVWRTWLFRFDDGTWSLGNSMLRGTKSQIGVSGESELAATALAGHAVDVTPR